jgi:hypothetical protein
MPHQSLLHRSSSLQSLMFHTFADTDDGFCSPVACVLVVLGCLLHPSRPMSTSISTNRMMERVRVELFFKDKSELRERVRFLHENGVRAFNLVNKDKKDALARCVCAY